jgi:3-phosphoshikimate 1-carboxyvinyltransferase
VIKNALTARWKECDRITAICKELTKMGAKIIEKKDGLTIIQDGTWKLHGAKADGYKDHRMVLSLAVAGLNIDGETVISDAETVEKSFETFFPGMQEIGANLQVIDGIKT